MTNGGVRVAGLLRALWVRFRVPLILLAIYFAAEVVVVALAAEQGLFMPLVRGQGLGVLLAVALVLILRIVAYFLVPLLVAYKLANRVWERVAARRRGSS